MAKRLRLALRTVAVFNMALLGTDLLSNLSGLRPPPLATDLIPPWFLAAWAFLTSLFLPVWAFVEIVKMNDASEQQHRKAVLIDAALAFGWFLFFWTAVLWRFTHTITWI